MKKVLIFGISGFSGRAFEHMVGRMGLEREYHFIGVDIDIHRAARTGSVEYVEGNAFDKGFIEVVISRYRPEYIVNLIGIFSAESFEMYYHGNLEITRQIFEMVLRVGLDRCRCLIIGSAAEYGVPRVNPVCESEELRPVNIYGLTKVFQTQLATFYHRIYGVPVVIARTFNIFGQGQSEQLAVGSFGRQIKEAHEGDKIQVGNLDAFRDYIDVEEAVKAYWILLLFGNPGEVYNVCSGTATRMSQILERMIKESGKNLQVVVDKQKFKTTEVPMIIGDNGKLKSLLV